MPKLNPIKALRLIKILHQLGFVLLRVRGSHHFLIHSSTRKTATVPVHARKDLGGGILKQILDDVGLTIEEYEKLRLGK